MKVYISGKWVDEKDAKVSVFDHGLLYGDGVFEGIRIYNNRVFLLSEHIDRLYDSAKAIALTIPMDKADMMEAVAETCRANELSDGYIRLVVTRGKGSLGLNPYLCDHPEIIIIAAKIQLYPRDLYENGLKIVTVGTVRNHPEAINPRIKSLNYLNNVLAKIEAINAGCMECLMLNHKGEVAEASGDNVFVIRKGTIFTPPSHSGALEGLTRNKVIELARASGYEVLESTMARYDLYVADEVFLTGTAAEIISVVEIDKRPIGDGKPGSITDRLATLYADHARSNGYNL
jgi:branched-chain amino acid aminotransferase